MAVTEMGALVRAASLSELRAAGRLVVGVGGQTLCLFADGDAVHAVDNRCPHMGFPLHRGTVADGILTCHWHHARFDLCSGGTFDQWADDVRRFPVELRDDDVYVDIAPREDRVAHQRSRLGDGLERNISLVLAKATIALAEADPSGADAFRAGLDFGVERRGDGWGRGLTTLTCFMNLVPALDEADVPVALYHGLADVSSEAASGPPRFPLEPLPSNGASVDAARALVPALRRRARRGGRRARARLGGARGRLGRGARATCCSPRRPTTATSTSATRSTS